jgi:DNA-3-methyladenine glycosylase
MKPLERSFYERDTLAVTRDLLGKRLVRLVGGTRLSGFIVETEAYIGEGDSACHASRGRTRRNAVMFGPPGYAYVYFVYGMHYCLNAVTEAEGFPAAVLIRALEPAEGLEEMRRRRGGCPDHQLANGPARLCQALGIGRALNGADLCAVGPLFIADGPSVPDEEVLRTPRVGISYAEEKDQRALWRFLIKK